VTHSSLGEYRNYAQQLSGAATLSCLLYQG